MSSRERRDIRRERSTETAVDPDEVDGEEPEGDLTADQTPESSLDDLTTPADPGEFATTFTDDDALLDITGGFDPTAGTKQVIPRIAYTINFNFVWNPDTQRWEPKKKGSWYDGFEDEDLSEYTVDSGSYSVTQTDPLEGQSSLRASGLGAFQFLTFDLFTFPQPLAIRYKHRGEDPANCDGDIRLRDPDSGDQYRFSYRYAGTDNPAMFIALNGSTIAGAISPTFGTGVTLDARICRRVNGETEFVVTDGSTVDRVTTEDATLSEEVEFRFAAFRDVTYDELAIEPGAC